MDGRRPCGLGPDDLGHPRPKGACRTEFGDREELVVVGGESEADLCDSVGDRQPGLGEVAQIGHPGRDGAGQLPRRAGAQVVQCGPVHGDGPHPTAVADGRARHRDHLVEGGGGYATQRSGQRIGAQVHRQPGTLLVVESAEQAKHRVGGGTVVGTGVQDHRHQVQEHTLEQSVQLGGPHATQLQRAHPVGEGAEHGGVALGDGGLAGQREHLDDLPAGVHVTQRVGTTGERPLPRQRRFGMSVQRGVERPHREAFVGGRIEQTFGLGGQVRWVAAAALGQHTGHPGPPALAIRFNDARGHSRLLGCRGLESSPV
jgi:hypothetical protein